MKADHLSMSILCKHNRLTPEIQAKVCWCVVFVFCVFFPNKEHKLDHESHFPESVILKELGNWEPKLLKLMSYHLKSWHFRPYTLNDNYYPSDSWPWTPVSHLL